MKRFLVLLNHDMRFQFRHGFYWAYLVATLAYIGIIYLLPPTVRRTATLLCIFIDTSVLGMFFVGALVLLERDQNTLAPLFLTPIRLEEYLASKIVSLTLLALLSSLAIVVSVQGLHGGILLVAWAVAGISLFFTLVGLFVAAKATSVPDYFIRGIGWGLLLCVPLLDYFGVLRSPLFFLLPSQPTLVLLDQSFGMERPGVVVLSAILSVAWILPAAVLARKGFMRNVLQRKGASR
jgi:fluoroquinolone transport system permease protein